MRTYKKEFVFKTKYPNSYKKKLCSGCQSDRYNHPGLCERPGIDAPVASSQCWSLEDAKVCRKGVYFTPYQQRPRIVKTLTCYQPQR